MIVSATSCIDTAGSCKMFRIFREIDIKQSQLVCKLERHFNSHNLPLKDRFELFAHAVMRRI